ncbi:MAG: HIT family protein [Acidobacteriaceae bacterium]|nr:HIT family protein [Acidobacteriaceae bacterium]
METPSCVFCKIAGKNLAAYIVYEDEEAIAFLDSHPLFPGHVLLSPLKHYETLLDLPPELAGSMMRKTQLLARAVQSAMEAEGTFIAINNYVSQTVPHLHIHVVPRRRRDGLRGFFWPRQQYKDDAAREAARTAIQREIQKAL